MKCPHCGCLGSRYLTDDVFVCNKCCRLFTKEETLRREKVDKLCEKINGKKEFRSW